MLYEVITGLVLVETRVELLVDRIELCQCRRGESVELAGCDLLQLQRQSARSVTKRGEHGRIGEEIVYPRLITFTLPDIFGAMICPKFAVEIPVRRL